MNHRRQIEHGFVSLSMTPSLPTNSTELTADEEPDEPRLSSRDNQKYGTS
jgi:hypothetical protein